MIAINHLMMKCSSSKIKIDGLKSEILEIENIIQKQRCCTLTLSKKDEETSNLTDEEYRNLVELAKNTVSVAMFQLVLSRRFEQKFQRRRVQCLQNFTKHQSFSLFIFDFDYGDYKLMGSSPESQLIIQNHKAIIHPIAGTFRRTGDTEKDLQSVETLKKDPKENAEHTMLVDLAETI